MYKPYDIHAQSLVERAVETMYLRSCDTVLTRRIALAKADELDKIYSAIFGYRALLYTDVPLGCISLTLTLYRVRPCALVNEETCPR